ncbi:MAG: N-acetylmuramoyl-L-alanine amidase [Ignavibacteriae bacterium]|nr:N-acetylmuramoyl-L-alanine amidase [Ignavibacteriota bacterium]NOG96693.1 N-acetylmuramoyl-L-alanine amidase [Ignavibacteriota bacterium]
MKFFISLFILVIVVSCSTSQKNEIVIQELDYPEELNVITREAWGSAPLTKTLPQHEINKITLHHSGVEFKDQENVLTKIKNLQSWSRSEKEWIDIPYHFMIDLEGNIYEGRPINYPGATNTEYDPIGHALIEVMGNYEVQKINDKQLKAVIDLSAYLAQEFNVPAEEIKGHKDYSSQTVCPGEDLYKYLADGTIVAGVRERIEK